jgi:peroxiredoxin
MTRCMTVLWIVMAITLLAMPVVLAADLKVGDDAPKWKGIIGIDDKEHALADYKDAKVIVLVFITNHCPVAKAYEDRLIAVQKDYKGKGVQLIALNVNNLPEDKLDKMKERAAEKKFGFPYLYDPTQAIGLAYGAKVTPHAFILDQKRKVVYVGAVDDNMKAAEAKSNYLRDALDALLAGKQPPKAETKPVGCVIQYAKK